MIERPTTSEGGSRALLVGSVMLATLMQALDTTIANVALPDMQGSLSATHIWASWVLTSYIVAAAILTPVTGWLAGRLGRRRLLIIAVAGFTVASLLCAMATGIGQMVLFRILQGVFGASLVPISQSLLLDAFPKEKHGAAMAMWGMGIMVGPILGPPLGGWLTEYYSWHWVFLINLPVGVVALLGIMASVKPETPRARPLDAIGLGLLALGIGALQLFLDRGETMDWLGSLEIQVEAALAFLALYLYGLWWWNRRDRALLDLGLLGNRNFAVGCVLIFVVGIVLFATLALMPPYLNTLMHYPVLTIGMVLAPRGVGTMFTMMLVGRMLGRVDARIPILVGMGLMVLSLHGMSQFGTEASIDAVVWLGVVQGAGLAYGIRADLDDRLFDAASVAAHRGRGPVQPGPAISVPRSASRWLWRCWRVPPRPTMPRSPRASPPTAPNRRCCRRSGIRPRSPVRRCSTPRSCARRRRSATPTISG